MRALAFACRTATICLLTPLVVVLGVATLAGLVVLAAIGFARTSSAALQREDRADASRRFARASADAADGVGVHQPA
ncbi:MAG: hypothetical protein QOJ35_2974 [Solirubrobacteraceae bacterium]|jgi:hypothetical protein|nr:hypothetical protein [Solirubrobacteraceae bacterium]